jgi:hypothetical protein
MITGKSIREALARGAVLAGFIAAPALAQGPERFELICNGTVAHWSASGQESAPWETQVRVDLSRDRLCLDDCRNPETVSANQAGRIEALAVGQVSLSPDDTDLVDRTNIDRLTGQFYRVHDWLDWSDSLAPAHFSGVHRDIYSGSCVPTQFTALARPLF